MVPDDRPPYSDPLAILRDLYASEINYRISAFWDGGYQIQLGDLSNGFLDEQIGLMSWQEIADWLTEAAFRHYPNSAFAEKHGRPRPGAEEARQRVGSAAGPLAGSQSPSRGSNR